ncbi:hypothetical protein [Streptomyces sediminimaris]|uniref:hypothetical protein n=1 Tax=Streptomyces sediminimaris TaxID=3383721 RepID=UPI00399AA878
MNLPEMTQPAYYTEERSALRWPLVLHGFLWPLLLVASFTTLAVTGDYVFMIGVILGIFGSVGLGGIHLAENRPVGIRVDSAGIWIGGIRRYERARAGVKPQTKLSRARAQRRQVFFCPWDAVQRVEVITERREIRKFAKLGEGVGASRTETASRAIRLGLLTAPYMRAVLVLNVDLSAASVPRFRPPAEGSFWKPGSPQRFAPSPVWCVPTRHPEQLRTALAQVTSRP